MMRFLLGLILLIGFSNSHAQFWTAKGGVYGGTEYEIINHAASGAIVTISNGGIFRSTDNGATWTRSSNGIVSTDISIRGLTQDASGKLFCNSRQRVYSSTDGGLSWVQTTTVTNFFGFLIKVSPVNGNIFVSEENGSQILRSTDGGQTFNPTTVSVNSGSISDMEINSSGHVVVSVRGQSALYITTNNGTGWSPMSSGSYTGFPALNVNHTYRIAIDNSNNLFVLTDTAPYRLASGATAWSNIKGTLTETSFYGNIFASGTNVFLTNNSVSKLFTYNGTTWNTGVSCPFNLDNTSFLAKSSTEFYLGVTNLGIYKSTNSGVAWAASSTGIKGFSYSDLHATPTGRLFAAWYNVGYMLSLDDGLTWDLNVAGNANRYLTGFVTLSDNSILGYGTGAIRSVDNGNNWTVQNASQSLPQVVVNGTNLFSYSGTSLLTSINQGVTWTSTAITGLPAPNKIQVDASNNVYFLSGNSLYKVLAGATTATLVAGVSSVRDITIISNTIFVLSVNGTQLAKSVDGGTSWTMQTLTSNFYGFKIWAYDTKVLITQGNTNGTSSLSTDGGATWTSNPLPDSFGTLTDVLFRGSGQSDVFAYAAVNNSVVIKSTNEIVPPATPTGLSIIVNGYGFVEFMWNDNADNEDDYIIETSIGNNSSYTVAGNAGVWGPETGNFTNFGYGYISISANTTYFIRVNAKNGAGNSGYSNEISLTTINQCPTTIPDNRSWTATTVADPGYTPFGSGPYTNPSVSLKLTTNSANIFKVSRYVLGIIDPNYQGHPDQSISIIESCNQAYVYQSSDDLNNSNGSWNSATNTLVIKWRTHPYYDDFRATTTFVLNPTDPVPAIPSLALFSYSNTEVFVSWSQPGYETQYVIQRSTSAGGPYTDINLAYPKSSYVDKSLITGTQYFYRIKALNSTGSSAYSTQQTITLTGGNLFRPVENDISLNFDNQQGVSWGDLDGDGDEDIATPSFTNNAGLSVPPLFYENMGGGAFNRRDFAVLSNDNDAVSRGINLVDFNNDGKLDIYITRSGSNIPDLLLINNGNWNFNRIAVTATAFYDNGFRSSAAADYDNDGFIDLYVGNDKGSYVSPSLPGFLLKNNDGNFSKIETGSLASDQTNARISSWADYDNDGDQDILVANDVSPASPMKLYKNNGDGTFTRVTGTLFDSDPVTYTRTLSWGDIDNDGDLDLYIGQSSASIAPSVNDRLYRNDGNNLFTSLSTSVVAANGTATFGSTFGDIDNDGDQDLLVANTGANDIFLNNGVGTFTKSTSNELFTNPNLAEIGIALADFDGDGFLDVYPSKGQTTAVDLPNFLYKNNGTPSASKNWIEIKLEGTISNRSAIGARITLVTTTPARTQIREVSSRTGYGSQNSLIQHFGLGTATSITSITVSWPSGIVQTINTPPINQLLTIVEDNTGPSVSALSPLKGSIGVAINTNLEITLTDVSPVSAVAGKNILLYLSSNLITPVLTFNANTLVQAGNKFTLDVPDLQLLTSYSIAIEAGTFKDVYGNTSQALPTSEWFFTTIDNIPPTLAFTLVPTIDKGFASPFTFNATASDNSGTVASVSMWHRKVSAKPFTELVGVNDGLSTEWNFSAQSSFFDETGLQYYFIAKDGSGNPKRLPAEEGKYFVTRINYPASAPPSLTLVKGNGAISGYQIISIPWEISNKDISSNFEELGGGDITKYRFLRYHETPTPGWDEYPGTLSSFARGEGYFLNVTHVSEIVLQNGVAPKENRDTLFTLSLKKGWNQIGNPYLTAIQWNDVLAYNSITSGVSSSLLLFGGTKYNVAPAPGVIEPFKGGFVQADADVAGLKIPFQGQTSGGRIGNFGKELAGEAWEVNFLLQQNDLEFSVGSIGMEPRANEGKDIFDMVVPPPLFEDQIEMTVAHPEHFMKRFARDVVSTQNEFTWEFDVDAMLDETAQLSWDNAAFGDNAKELYLFDVVLQKAIDMRTEGSYSFNPMESNRFRIYFGEKLKDKIRPDKIFLGKAFPNPSTGVSVVPFTLPENGSNYQVRLEVFNMLGQKVSTLVEGQYKPGFYTTEWNTADTNLNGLYTYRLVVSGQNLKDVQSGKIILMK